MWGPAPLEVLQYRREQSRLRTAACPSFTPRRCLCFQPLPGTPPHLPSRLVQEVLYITLLRDPVSALPERGGTCSGGPRGKAFAAHVRRAAARRGAAACCEGHGLVGLHAAGFMDCPYNLANNRQVRMLADLSLGGLHYNLSFIPEGKRAQLLLDSAKKNLRGMAFFGLTSSSARRSTCSSGRSTSSSSGPSCSTAARGRAAWRVAGTICASRLNGLDSLAVRLCRGPLQQRYQYKRRWAPATAPPQPRGRLLHRAKERRRRGRRGPGRVPTEDYMSHILEKW